MSGFYRETKRLFSKYKIINREDQVMYWGSIIYMLIAILGFYDHLQRPFQNENVGIWYLIIGFGCYFFAKYKRNKMDKERFNGISELIESDEINFVLIESLIGEIESYINGMKKISQWSIGILSTIIILIITFLSGTVIKITEFIFNSFDKNEQKALSELMISDINDSNVWSVEWIFGSGFSLLIIILLPLLLGYFYFFSLTYRKKQILLGLYDIKYKYLILGKEVSDVSNEDLEK